MDRMRPSPDPQMRYRQLSIICGAMAASVVMVNIVLTFLHASGSLPAPKDGIPEALSLALFAVSLILLVASPAFKRRLLKRAEAEGYERNVNGFAGAYATATIVAFAMREAGGLMGFVLGLITGNPWWSWGLGGAALLAMAMDWPRREVLG